MATNRLLNGLQQNANWGYTENGGVKHNTTGSAVYDMFALGAAYRTRSEDDCILLFKNALAEDEALAMKCLFYIGDCRGGAGERRFFRVCYHWLANNKPGAAKRNLQYIPEYRRWDDLYELVGTKLEEDAFAFMKHQLALDIAALGTKNGAVSLLAKWLKSENTSSADSRALGTKTRKYLGLTSRQYRKTLSKLRERINVLERLMSANRWDAIEFDKIPSRAGFIYRNAFARHDLERMKAQPKAVSYKEFAQDENTKVNATVLFPYECVAEAVKKMRSSSWGSSCLWDGTDTERAMINKYWANLSNYFNGCSLNALAVVDTSGSMRGSAAMAPINVATSLGMYCAERAKGPFAGHYISFSRIARLVKVEGVDFCDKVRRIYGANLCENTNLESVFELLLRTAVENRCKQEDLPQVVIVISDMEIDYSHHDRKGVCTMMEAMRSKWAHYGYALPRLIYWNVQARQNGFVDAGPNVSFVSGASPALFEQIMKMKSGRDLMEDKLNSERYKPIC